MKYTFRALLAVGLLVGFYAGGLAIVVALAYAGYLLSVVGVRVLAGGLWILAVVVAIAIGRGIFSQQKHADPDRGSLLLGEAEQPELWREVRELAGFAATRAPDEIRLVARTRTPPWRETTLLGTAGAQRSGSSAGSSPRVMARPWRSSGPRLPASRARSGRPSADDLGDRVRRSVMPRHDVGRAASRCDPSDCGAISAPASPSR